MARPKEYNEEIERLQLYLPRSVKPKVVAFAKKECDKVRIKKAKIMERRKLVSESLEKLNQPV